jgi:hypothetical protein
MAIKEETNMAMVEFSSKGVAELRQLENSLLDITVRLEDLSQKLSTDAHAVETGLGDFSSMTLDFVDNIVRVCKEGSSEVASLQVQINRLASDMEEVLASL